MELKFVRPWDPAIDREAMKAAEKWEPFLETFESKHVIVRDGETATLFHCVPLTRKQRRNLDGKLPEQKREYAFSCGVITVEHKRFPDGSFRPWSRSNQDRPMSESEIELFAERDAQQIGEAIMSHSFCEAGEPVFVPLLVTSQHALIAAGIASASRPAAPTKP